MAIETITETGTWRVKSGLAQMLKGGVIMDVVTAEEAKIAEDAGAVSVMALERVPSDIRKDGGVARMADPTKIIEIMEAVTIPVMAKCRIGHFVEAQVLEALGTDYIDESEVLTPADEENHVDKHQFRVPFVCGCRNLGEALRRIGEGAAMIRTKGEAGTGNVVEAVRHARSVMGEIRRIQGMGADELMTAARDMRAPYELVKEVHDTGKLPVVNFAAGGIASPADAALMMQLGVEGVFVGSGYSSRRTRSAWLRPSSRRPPISTTPGSSPTFPGVSATRCRAWTSGPCRRRSSSRSGDGSLPNVGILAIQGDVIEHRHALERIGAETTEIRLPEQLDGVDGLIIPGGESTTIVQLIDIYDLRDVIRDKVKSGLPTWGTCAGMIVLADRLTDRRPDPLRLMNIDVSRNAFGRQFDSFEQDLDIDGCRRSAVPRRLHPRPGRQQRRRGHRDTGPPRRRPTRRRPAGPSACDVVSP